MGRARKKGLEKEQRTALIVALSEKCKDNGRPLREAMSAIAEHFGVSRSTVWRIWKRSKIQMSENGAIDLSTKMNFAGRKKVTIDLEKMLRIELRKRTSIRRLAKELGISKFVVGRRFQEGVIRRHTNSLKPMLTAENKKARLQFCLSMVEFHVNGPRFNSMYNFIHIDEKWFYLTKDTVNYYLVPEELDPYRTCKSKRFITKVMFLSTVARPVNDEGTDTIFDGKLGIFPFTVKRPAQRLSKNRGVGTIETKAIEAVTQEIYRSYLIEKLLPAIKSKWPHIASPGRVYIQQDNARPHIGVDDVQFEEAVRREGLDVKLVCQPPNSPDMNVLDLGYFRAIQSLQQQEYMKTVDELVAAVEKSFEELSSEKLTNVFLTLQHCMAEVIKVKGGNNYRIPHVNKQRLAAEGTLPSHVTVVPELIDAAHASLADCGG